MPPQTPVHPQPPQSAPRYTYNAIISIKSKEGMNGVGRVVIYCDRPIDSLERLREEEQNLLAGIQKDRNDIEDLFITNIIHFNK